MISLPITALVPHSYAHLFARELQLNLPFDVIFFKYIMHAITIPDQNVSYLGIYSL